MAFLFRNRQNSASNYQNKAAPHFEKIIFNTANPNHIHENDGLSDEEIKYIHNLHNSETVGDKFTKAYIHQNHAAPSNNRNPVKGCCFEFDDDVQAHPRFMNDEFSTHMIGSKIKERADLNDNYFISKKHKLQNNLSRDENFIGLHLLSDNSKDSEAWNPSLGQNGYVQVVKESGRKGRGEYYLFVKSDAGQLGSQLKNYIGDQFQTESPLTLKKFLNSKQYIKARDLSKRNSRRILHIASGLLGVELESGLPGVSKEACTQDDHNALIENEHDLVPKMAIPQIANEYNIFSSKNDKIHYHSYTTPTNQATGKLYHMSDHTDKVRLYNLPSNDKIHNDYGSSFSPFTARNNQEVVDNSDDHSFINDRYLWHNKNHNFHPKLYNKYKMFDQNTNHINEKLLNVSHGYTDLDPVIAIIPSPK